MSAFEEDIDEEGRSFLLALYEQTEGDSARQVSMYDIGQGLGMERDEASRAGEDLMGAGLVEVRTLAGGIGLTADGVAAARNLSGGSDEAQGVRLGTDPVMEPTVCQAVTSVTDGLKCEAGKSGFDFEPLTELVADLKTVDAQLMSSRPKTAIIRECLRSIRHTLGRTHLPDWAAQIDRLTGDN